MDLRNKKIVDHYAALQVKRNATQEEIKKAYRELAATHHPDHGGDTNTFQAINAAYDVLGDAERRKKYDDELRKSILSMDIEEVVRNRVMHNLGRTKT